MTNNTKHSSSSLINPDKIGLSDNLLSFTTLRSFIHQAREGVDAERYKKEKCSVDTEGSNFSMLYYGPHNAIALESNSYICHGPFTKRRFTPITPEYLVDFFYHGLEGEELELFYKWINYLMHESPFKDSFVYADSSGDIPFVIHKTMPGKQVFTGFNLIASRFAKDTIYLSSMYKKALDAGWSNHTAFIVACTFSIRQDNDGVIQIGSSETNPINTGFNLDYLLNIFKTGHLPEELHQSTNRIWKTIHSDSYEGSLTHLYEGYIPNNPSRNFGAVDKNQNTFESEGFQNILKYIEERVV